MRKTPLFLQHQSANAVMASFAGWQMPMHYGSSVAEHHAVRQSAGMFDVSHMTVCDVRGADALAFCQRVLANDVGQCVIGHAMYTCMLNEQGGVIDDLIAYVMPALTSGQASVQHIRLILNAGTFEQDMAWLREQSQTFEVTLDLPEGLAMLAVQGPQALAICSAVLPAELADGLSSMRPFQTHCASVEGQDWQVATTGYTGEAGVELVVPAAQVMALWQALLGAGVQPCGLAARDSLRLEAGYALYGQDMDQNTSPLVSALGWTIRWQPERDFIGREALLAQKAAGLKEHLLGVILVDRGVLRHGQTLTQAGQTVGVITSGGFSPTRSVGIGLARLQKTVQVGDTVETVVRGKTLSLEVVKPPLIKQGK